VLPSDSVIENIDPIEKQFLFINWMHDQTEKFDLAKNHAYLIGSFINPEAAKKLSEGDDTKIESETKDFEKSLEMVSNFSQRNKKKRT
jgi:hypothetical protein